MSLFFVIIYFVKATTRIYDYIIGGSLYSLCSSLAFSPFVNECEDMKTLNFKTVMQTDIADHSTSCLKQWCGSGSRGIKWREKTAFTQQIFKDFSLFSQQQHFSSLNKQSIESMADRKHIFFKPEPKKVGLGSDLMLWNQFGDFIDLDSDPYSDLFSSNLIVSGSTVYLSLWMDKEQLDGLRGHVDTVR